jgi:cell division protein FtsL
MSLFSLFTRRFRGFRVVDLLAGVILLVVALGGYAYKTFAVAKGADAESVQAEIVQENKRIRLLQAEAAHLEDPSRIERLSKTYLNMGPIAPGHEISLAELERVATPPPAPPAAPPAPAKP